MSSPAWRDRLVGKTYPAYFSWFGGKRRSEIAYRLFLGIENSPNDFHELTPQSLASVRIWFSRRLDKGQISWS